MGLIDLLQDVPVQLFYGEPYNVVSSLIKWDPLFQAVYISEDYTPYARMREESLKQLDSLDVHIITNHILLPSVDALMTGNASPYKIFSGFKNSFQKKIKVPFPVKILRKNFLKGPIPGTITLSDTKKFYTEKKERFGPGGRKNALEVLNNIKEFRNYAETRSSPSLKTTGLSAHLKFGTISIREFWAVLSTDKI